jgi:D-sedoheptulose 7-phosphate isomerase
MELKEILNQHLQEASNILRDFSTNTDYLNSVVEAAEIIITSLESGNKIISAGNGGSMCDAMHFAEELSGRYRNDRKGLAAVSISDPSHITCVGNDYGFNYIFSRYIQALGNPGDVFFGITTSGNSENIIRACMEAKNKDMKVIVLTSDCEGDLQVDYEDLVDAFIKTPSNRYADRIQELHIKIIHSLINMIEEKLINQK